MHLSNTSDVDGSKGVPSNPESHMFGLPIVGGTGGLLLWHTVVCVHILKSYARHGPVVGVGVVIIVHGGCNVLH
jgi:hypothetical protein